MIHHVAIGDNFDNIIKSVQETQHITHVCKDKVNYSIWEI